MTFPERRSSLGAADDRSRQRPLDPMTRRALYGPIRSMAQPGRNSLWQWLFGAE